MRVKSIFIVSTLLLSSIGIDESYIRDDTRRDSDVDCSKLPLSGCIDCWGKFDLRARNVIFDSMCTARSNDESYVRSVDQANRRACACQKARGIIHTHTQVTSELIVVDTASKTTCYHTCTISSACVLQIISRFKFM